jgi:hypothetical protein
MQIGSKATQDINFVNQNLSMSQVPEDRERGRMFLCYQKNNIELK